MTGSQGAAQAVFLAWLRENDANDEDAFEALCAAHPDLREALEEQRAGWGDGDSEILLGLGGLLAARLVGQPESGASDDVESRVTAAGELASELLERLSDRGTDSPRYKLKKEVARGGMGAVLKVWDSDMRRHLAMKVMLDSEQAPSDVVSDRTDPRTLGRFFEEAQISGQLQHPGIVPVHDLGVDPRGQVYFTMKLVKGKTLRDVFQSMAEGEGTWSRERVLGVLAKVCEAMSYAHERGVIHRDLKPANVMVGRHGEVYVMDWGVARVLSQPDLRDLRPTPEGEATLTDISTDRRDHAEQEPDSQLCTMDGAVLGTPAYMPPEQAAGDLERVGPPSDVYAVGAMLYHLLAGHMPYVKPGTRVSSYMVLRWVHEGPPRPLHLEQPGAPTELAAICEKAMARDIEDRYPDMGALSADLAAYMEGRVVAAHETGAWAEARKWVQRNRGLAASLAAALVLLVTGLLVSLYYMDAAERSAALADERTEQVREQERLASSLVQDVLQLSAATDLEALLEEEARLWPPHTDMVPRYEEWLARAQLLIDGREADAAAGIDARPSLADHLAKCAELQALHVPVTDPHALAQAAQHPSLPALEAKRSQRDWYERMLGLRPWPTEAEVAEELATWDLPSAQGEHADIVRLNAAAWFRVRPGRAEPGLETHARLIALQVASAAEGLGDDALRRGALETLAWARLRCGRLEVARSTMAEAEAVERALAETAVEERTEKDTSLPQLREELDRWAGEELDVRRAELEALQEDVSSLSIETGVWGFADPETTWWHGQLAALIPALELLADPVRGPGGDAVAEPFGWGVARRLAFARTVAARSTEGPEARSRWDEARASIHRSPRYDGLELSPQLGLLPIGEDPRSGLWEFAHLQSGVPAIRGEDGDLVLEEETGIVLVLLPAQTFWIGAQDTAPDEFRYDPAADEDEAPPRQVRLSSYFISKYELTQGQWLRITGTNPSFVRMDSPREALGPTLLNPVESVSWDACVLQLSRMGLHLPSEAQWECAARGATDTPYWTGQDRESLRGQVNLRDRSMVEHGLFKADQLRGWPDVEDGSPVHAEVGRFPANPFGLHEVLGNVSEWCQDGYYGDVYARSMVYAPALPADPVVRWDLTAQRAARGGNFESEASKLRASERQSSLKGSSNHTLGVRPMRSIDR